MRRVEMVEARRQAEFSASGKMAQPEPFSRVGTGRGNEGGARQTARDLGMPRDKVRRSLAAGSRSDRLRQTEHFNHDPRSDGGHDGQRSSNAIPLANVVGANGFLARLLALRRVHDRTAASVA